MKKIFKIIIVFLLMVGINVNAKGINNFFADDNLKVNEDINATAFAAGNNVDISSKVNGLNFVAGNNLTLSSSQDHLFAAGNNIQLNEVTTKDAFIAGSLIKINNSNIRDLYVAGETILINSNIERNIYAGGEKVTINGTIEGNVNIEAEEIVIEDETVIKGTLEYPEESKISRSKSASIGEIKTYKEEKVEVDYNPITNVLEKIISFVSLLVTGLILLTINKKLFKKIEKEDKNAINMLKNTCLGFALLILIPLVSIIMLFTILLMPLSIITLLIYGILIYLSMIASSYYIGNWIFKDKIKNNYLLLTVSLLIVYLFTKVPVIGGFISFISVCLGISIYINQFINNIKENK